MLEFLLFDIAYTDLPTLTILAYFVRFLHPLYACMLNNDYCTTLFKNPHLKIFSCSCSNKNEMTETQQPIWLANVN